METAGAHVIQVDEPAATTHPEEEATFVEGWSAATQGICAKVACHVWYSDYRLLYPHVLEIPAVCVGARQQGRPVRGGCDFLDLFNGYDDGREVGLRVGDVHVDDAEGPALIRDRLLRAAKVLDDPTRTYANPDCGLRTRRWEVAFAKLQNMVRGARLAKAGYTT